MPYTESERRSEYAYRLALIYSQWRDLPELRDDPELVLGEIVADVLALAEENGADVGRVLGITPLGVRLVRA